MVVMVRCTDDEQTMVVAQTKNKREGKVEGKIDYEKTKRDIKSQTKGKLGF